MQNVMKNIVIATPLYPPEIGGPAQYARELEHALSQLGHRVHLVKFSDVRALPSGIRHFLYCMKVMRELVRADACIALDTFSAAVPAVLAGMLVRKPVYIRTGGDFLWEQYVERTGDLVLLRDFYLTRMRSVNMKERAIMRVTRWALRHAERVIFSTVWQRDIWETPYGIDRARTAIIENYLGTRVPGASFSRKVFVGGTRQLKWKNVALLQRAFAKAKARVPDIELDVAVAEYDTFVKKISSSYAVILVSLGDISPNLIFDAIRYGKPFIVTRETGLFDQLKDVGIFVDPESEEEIAERIVELASDDKYEIACRNVMQYTHTHSWEDIANEFVALLKA